MPRVRVLRATFVDGQFVGEGPHELSEADAKALVRIGVAVAVTPADEPIPRIDPGIVTLDGDPQVESREPPARRRR